MRFDYEQSKKLEDQLLEEFKLLDLSKPFSFDYWSKFVNDDWLILNSAIRTEHIKQIGFHILTQEQLEIFKELLSGKRVIEVGCGSGWLTRTLGDAGIEITGIDDHSGSYRMGCWERAGIEKRCAIDYIKSASYESIIMAWPDYEEDFAFDIASAMKKGTTLFYQGEGDGGCTANDKFFGLTGDENQFQFLEMETESLNRWQRRFNGIHDEWSVFLKIGE